jgi:hypothetical protein
VRSFVLSGVSQLVEPRDSCELAATPAGSAGSPTRGSVAGRDLACQDRTHLPSTGAPTPVGSRSVELDPRLIRIRSKSLRSNSQTSSSRSGADPSQSHPKASERSSSRSGADPRQPNPSATRPGQGPRWMPRPCGLGGADHDPRMMGEWDQRRARRRSLPVRTSRNTPPVETTNKTCLEQPGSHL